MADYFVGDMTEEFLTALDNYLKVGLHIGTKFRTKYMAPFIYKIRPDGLAVLNVKKIDNRIDVVSRFLSQFEPKDILIVSRRENGWRAVKLFKNVTGVNVITGRYRPGLLTNTSLEDFKEYKVIMVVDPLPDKNAVKDAVVMGLPVIACCDTNNETNYIDVVIPCNNKGKKSLGLLFYIIAKEYLMHRGLIKPEEEISVDLETFIADE